MSLPTLPLPKTAKMEFVNKPYRHLLLYLSSSALRNHMEDIAIVSLGLFINQKLQVFHRFFHNLVEKFVKLK